MSQLPAKSFKIFAVSRVMHCLVGVVLFGDPRPGNHSGIYCVFPWVEGWLFLHPQIDDLFVFVPRGSLLHHAIGSSVCQEVKELVFLEHPFSVAETHDLVHVPQPLVVCLLHGDAYDLCGLLFLHV